MNKSDEPIKFIYYLPLIPQLLHLCDDTDFVEAVEAGMTSSGALKVILSFSLFVILLICRVQGLLVQRMLQRMEVHMNDHKPPVKRESRLPLILRFCADGVKLDQVYVSPLSLSHSHSLSLPPPPSLSIYPSLPLSHSLFFCVCVKRRIKYIQLCRDLFRSSTYLPR
jgi:hypothetical protein